MREVILFTTFCLPLAAESPQRGGPDRNFQVGAKGLADSWPAAGAKRLGTRPLGEGFSAIVSGGRLYTMHNRGQRGEEEVVVAIDAATGKTV